MNLRLFLYIKEHPVQKRLSVITQNAMLTAGSGEANCGNKLDLYPSMMYDNGFNFINQHTVAGNFSVVQSIGVM